MIINKIPSTKGNVKKSVKPSLTSHFCFMVFNATFNSISVISASHFQVHEYLNVLYPISRPLTSLYPKTILPFWCNVVWNTNGLAEKRNKYIYRNKGHSSRGQGWITSHKSSRNYDQFWNTKTCISSFQIQSNLVWKFKLVNYLTSE